MIEQNLQLSHVETDGAIEEIPLDLPGIGFLARTPDCRVWFLGGINSPHQQVGTLELVPHP